MSYQSPIIELYDINGNALAVQNATSIPASTPAIMVAGSDGTNSRYITVDGYGRPIIVGAGTAGSPVGGVVTIQGISSGQAVPISGAVTITSGSVTVSGTVTATVASVGSTGQAPPASADYMGGSVTTNAPSYTTGQMSALSLTTAGLLRIDGVAPTGAAGPSDAMYMAGAVTTSAPSYTTGQMDPLSLTTAGLLRVDGVYPANATTTNTPDLNFMGAAVTTSLPSYTTGQTSALSLDGYGGLRVTGTGTTSAPSAGILTVQGNASGVAIPVSGTFTTDKSSTGTITSVASSASSVTILASNANRILASVYNDSTSTLYLAMAGTATTSAYTIQIARNSYWELPLSYNGVISGIWSSANGNARITEYT